MSEEHINVKLSNGFVTSLDTLTATHRALIDHGDLSNLIGQLMQYIEATYQDKEQRDAHKRLVKVACRDWLSGIYDWQDGWNIKFCVNPKVNPEPDFEYTLGEEIK